MRNSRAFAMMIAAMLPGFGHAALAEPSDAAAVTITRDGFGIAHIHGRTDADAVFGMIYAQAEDDFPRIERNYLVALGRLAEVEGETALWTDLRQRLFVDPAALRRDYAASPRWLKALMDAWAAGLNHYLATHPDVRPRAITRFEPWMALAFSEGSIGGDIERGVDTAALAAFYGGATPPAPRVADAGRLVEPKGSNGFAFAPARSEGGHPLLWINPHTSFFFRAEQQVRSDQGLDVYGAATWGQFFVYQGFNRRLGWMHTSSGVDNIDEFAVEVARRGGQLRYRYGKAWRPIRSRVVTLSVRRPDGTQALRRFTTLATHHGPIIRAEGTGRGGRWIAVAMLNAPRAALEQSYLRTRATTLADYLAVAERKANSSNNTILAAADGTIAYLHPQFVPIRDARFDYTQPVDGSDPATDWRGLHRPADLPQVVNPASGWVMNTNNAPWTAGGAGALKPGDFPRYMDQFGENPRGRHALALFDNARRFSPQTLTRAAFDSLLPLFEEQIPGLARGHAALPAGDARKAALAAPLALLTGWDRRWSTTSEATSLAVYWGEALWASEGPRAKAAGLPLFTWLSTRTTDAARVDALATAVGQMRRDHGGWRIAWGRINRFQRLSGAIEPRFDDAAPSLPVGFTSGNFGSLAAFGVERQTGRRCFYGTSGNSFVAVVEFDPAGPRAWAVSAGGESGDPASPHFDDQARRYTTGDLRPIVLDADALRGFTPYRPGDPRPASAARAAVMGSACGEP